MAEVQVLKPLAATTTNGSSAGVSTPLGNTVGFYVTVTASSGTSPNLALKIDASVDGVNWASSVATFTAITATGTYFVSANIPSVQVRATWTITGTTPSFTFSVVAVGQTTAVAN